MDIGIIIGRFQSPHLTIGHHSLISQVNLVYDKTVVLLGVSATKGMERNPLDFDTRAKMIQESYPDVIISFVQDYPADDQYWSEQLDKQVLLYVSPEDTLTLCGGRDSFIPHYAGSIPTLELPTVASESGTEARARLQVKHPTTEEGRGGVIYAAYNKWNNPLFCVDIAVFKKNDPNYIALGQKAGETKWRLPGGFVDNDDNTLEDAVRRELLEETALDINNIQYVASLTTDDSRYKQSELTLKTVLFRGYSSHPNRLRAGDDLVHCEWININSLDLDKLVMPSHAKLLKKLL